MKNNLRAWLTKNPDVAMISVIVGFFVLFFWPLLFGDKYFVTSDAFFYSYPLRTLAWNAIHQGTFPLWTPLLMSGYPLLSMSQIALLYPLTWGYAIMPGYKAEVIYVLAPFLLAPTFTYLYARQVGRSRLGALLAGLAFGYGGMMAGMLANSGYTTNSVMWLPLILVGVERSRTHSFTHGLLWTTGAYTLSVFNGHGQTFIYVGLIALAYALFVAFVVERGEQKFFTWHRLKAVAAVLIAIGTAAGVSAFQVLETYQATDLSIRRTLSYEVFAEGSFRLSAMLKSALLPLHYDLEVTTYLSPLAIILAGYAVFRLGKSDRRIFFWAAMCVIAWVLMLGDNTPIYKLIYHIPVLNRFRVPARHSFEWTFAVGVLAAYGCDAVFNRLKHLDGASDVRSRYWIVSTVLFVAALIAFFWWRAVHGSSAPIFYARTGYPIVPYLIWKGSFFLVLLVGAWLARDVISVRWRNVLLGSVILLACFPEPYMLISRWWFTAAKPEQRFSVAASSTAFLQQHEPDQSRAYSRINLFVEENVLHPAVDPLNLTAIFRLRNVAGYEPLILERYSRALGDVGYDSVNPRPGYIRDTSILESRSHVLDLLNTRFVIAYSNPLYAEGTLTTTKEGIEIIDIDDPVNLIPGATARLVINALEADAVGLVTSLANAAEEIDGTPVAKVRITTVDNRTSEYELRAGIDTAEWAHDRSDVRPVIAHRLANVFSSRPGDKQSSFQAHNYWSKLSFGQRLKIRTVEISNLSQRATVVLWKGSFYNSATNYSVPLTNPLLGLPSQRWQLWEPPTTGTINKEGIQLSVEHALEIRPGHTVSTLELALQGDTIALVTSLAHAAEEFQGTTIATLRLTTFDGQVIERDLRVGIESAEWAHQRKDVREIVRHQMAPVFDSRVEPAAEPFEAYRYWAKISLGKRPEIRKVELVNKSAVASLTLWTAALYDSSTKTSKPLLFEESEKWQPVYDKRNVVILENSKVLPRAWLVAEARSVTAEEALHLIRGTHAFGFDPRRTALLEMPADKLPALPGGPISSNASARVVAHESNRLTIRTNSDSPSVLVVSEIAYPGWKATVDGSTVPIFVTDYLLRGVALPAGEHVVEMRYTAPLARKGLFISISTLVVFSGLLITIRRRRM